MNRSSVAALQSPASLVSGFGIGKLDTLFTPRTGISHSGRTSHVQAPRTVAMPTPEAGGLPETANAEEAQEAHASFAGTGGVVVEQASAVTAPTAISPADLDRMAVQAALHGNQAAFADLVTRYQTAVYNMAYRMLGDPTEAEDAAQEVFVRAWNQLHTFQLDRRFSTWLLSIASHYCIDLLRRRKPYAPLDDVALFVPSDDPQPEELALRTEQSEMVQRLLNTLPDKYRSVTVLRYYNDLSYDEIAKATGLTESAVKTQLHRARKMLADQLVGAGANSSTSTKGGTP